MGSEGQEEEDIWTEGNEFKELRVTVMQGLGGSQKQSQAMNDLEQVPGPLSVSESSSEEGRNKQICM